MILFRSILIPLKAVLGFVLSLMATLGFTTLVMQDGFMKGLFGIETTGPILAFLPVITIGILFGLAKQWITKSSLCREFMKNIVKQGIMIILSK